MMQDIDIPWSLIEAIKSMPLRREVKHCGSTFPVSPFDIYAECRVCGTRFKVRSFSGVTELERVFDAVFEWMNQPGAEEIVNRRRKEIAGDNDD
jgi:hypothetical protein